MTSVSWGVLPLLEAPHDGVHFDAEAGLGPVGGFVEIRPVDLADHQHVDVVRWRAGPTGIARRPGPEDHDLLDTGNGELLGDHHFGAEGELQ